MNDNFKSIGKSILDIMILLISILVIFLIFDFFVLLTGFIVYPDPKRNDEVYVQCIVFITITLFAWKTAKNKYFSEMGLKKLDTCSFNFIEGIVLGIISVSLCFLCTYLFGGMNIASANFFKPKKFIIGLILCILTGFSEEILIRGYIVSTIADESKKRKLIAIFITSIVFGCLYIGVNSMSILAVINLCLMGLLYGYMYYVTDNIWMSITSHITWNFIQLLIFGVNPYSNKMMNIIACRLSRPYLTGNDLNSILVSSAPNESIFNGGSFGLEGSIFCTIIIILQLAYIYRKQEKKNHSDSFI